MQSSGIILFRFLFVKTSIDKYGTCHIHILSHQCERIVRWGGQPEERMFRIVNRILSNGFRQCYRIGGVVEAQLNAFNVTQRRADHKL